MARLTVEEADRLAQERPPYPPPSDVPAEQCPGPTGWHRPQVEDWNRGNRESTCTWCQVPIGRNFADPVWRTKPVAEMPDDVRVLPTGLAGNKTIEQLRAEAAEREDSPFADEGCLAGRHLLAAELLAKYKRVPGPGYGPAYETGYRDGAHSLIADIHVRFTEFEDTSMDDLLGMFRNLTGDDDLEWPDGKGEQAQ